MQVSKEEFGYSLENEKFFFCFGNANSQLQNLKELFRDLKFSRIVQKHTDQFVQIEDREEDQLRVADASWTKLSRQALCINTADCIPILGYHSQQNLIVAIHAGWRGVQNQILEKTIHGICQQTGAGSSDWFLFIGPHIQKQSFEIDEPNAKLILQTVGVKIEDVSSDLFEPTTDGKGLLDLNAVIKLQMQKLNVSGDQIHNLFIDTRTNLEFHSYRRDRENSGRQISFIAKK